MRSACLMIFLSASLLLSGASRTHEKTKSKSQVAKAAVVKAKPETKSLKSSKRSAIAGRSAAAGKKGSARLAATRLVRTKSGRLARVVVHVPPPPSYQTHPDPDRYIEIQRALADRGYFKGEPNGEWADDSVDALRRFQAVSNLPDDGKISALSLTGLGLGPRHDGSTASTVPLSTSDSATPGPAIIGSTVDPTASSPAAGSPLPIPAAPAHPPNR